MLEWLLFACIGMISGLFSGLLGLGGGLIIVPALLFVFQWQGLATTDLIHLAIATSLMTITVTSLSSAYSHHRHHNVDWSLAKKLTPGLLLGGMLGAIVATQLSASLLKYCFVIYVFFVVFNMWLPSPKFRQLQLLNNIPVILFSTSTGIISALVGIGGGTLIVPYLVMAQQSIQRAIATSSACGFPISIAAVVGFIFIAQPQSIVSNWQTGFIHWQAFLGIISTSIVFSFLGAKLVKNLPVLFLKKLFSIVVFLLAIYLLSTM